MTFYDDPNRQAVGLDPAWVEGDGATGGNQGPFKSAIKPGDSFPPDPAVTAQDPTTAAALDGLGYVPADPSTSWGSGEYFAIDDGAGGTHIFFYDGADWQPGVHAATTKSTKKASSPEPATEPEPAS